MIPHFPCQQDFSFHYKEWIKTWNLLLFPCSKHPSTFNWQPQKQNNCWINIFKLNLEVQQTSFHTQKTMITEKTHLMVMANHPRPHLRVWRLPVCIGSIHCCAIWGWQQLYPFQCILHLFSDSAEQRATNRTGVRGYQNFQVKEHLFQFQEKYIFVKLPLNILEVTFWYSLKTATDFCQLG